MTIWLLNSAVVAAGAYGTYTYRAASIPELARAVQLPFTSRIGYPETADVIKRMTGVRPDISREASALEPGDVAFVVRLRYRVDPQRKGSPAARDDADWEIGRLERVA